MRHVADGITILNRYGNFSTACWVFHHGGEAAVIEMPPFNRMRENAPYDDVRKFTDRFGIYLKYAFLSHTHWDHCRTLPYFRKKFMETTFVTHTSFYHDRYFRSLIHVIPWRRGARSRNVQTNFDDVFSEPLWYGSLGGEPLYVIHAPKHSYADLLIVFKGAMITGDWYIGDLIDCNNLVRPQDKINSVNMVEHIIGSLGYSVHMLFAAHGNNLLYDVDFFSVMEQCKVRH